MQKVHETPIHFLLASCHYALQYLTNAYPRHISHSMSANQLYLQWHPAIMH